MWRLAARMDTIIRGSMVALRNANDGISWRRLPKTRSARSPTPLQRMRELAVRASNATLSSGDRDNLEIEFLQMQEEIPPRHLRRPVQRRLPCWTPARRPSSPPSLPDRRQPVGCQPADRRYLHDQSAIPSASVYQLRRYRRRWWQCDHLHRRDRLRRSPERHRPLDSALGLSRCRPRQWGAVQNRFDAIVPACGFWWKTSPPPRAASPTPTSRWKPASRVPRFCSRPAPRCSPKQMRSRTTPDPALSERFESGIGGEGGPNGLHPLLAPLRSLSWPSIPFPTSDTAPLPRDPGLNRRAADPLVDQTAGAAAEPQSSRRSQEVEKHATQGDASVKKAIAERVLRSSTSLLQGWQHRTIRSGRWTGVRVVRSLINGTKDVIRQIPSEEILPSPCARQIAGPLRSSKARARAETWPPYRFWSQGGLDINAIIGSSLAAEQQPLTNIDAKAQKIDARISAENQQRLVESAFCSESAQYSDNDRCSTATLSDTTLRYGNGEYKVLPPALTPLNVSNLARAHTLYSTSHGVRRPSSGTGAAITSAAYLQRHDRQYQPYPGAAFATRSTLLQQQKSASIVTDANGPTGLGARKYRFDQCHFGRRHRPRSAFVHRRCFQSQRATPAQNAIDDQQIPIGSATNTISSAITRVTLNPDQGWRHSHTDRLTPTQRSESGRNLCQRLQPKLVSPVKSLTAFDSSTNTGSTLSGDGTTSLIMTRMRFPPWGPSRPP